MKDVMIDQPVPKARPAVIMVESAPKSKSMPVIVHADAQQAQYATFKPRRVRLGDTAKEQFEKLAKDRLIFFEDGIRYAQRQLKIIRKRAAITDVSDLIADFHSHMRQIEKADANRRGLRALITLVGTSDQELKVLAKTLIQQNVGSRADLPRMFYPEGKLYGDTVFVQLPDDSYACEIELEHADGTIEVRTIMASSMYVAMKKEKDAWMYCPALSDWRVIKSERFSGSVAHGLVSYEDENKPTSGYVNSKKYVDALFKGSDYDSKRY